MINSNKYLLYYANQTWYSMHTTSKNLFEPYRNMSGPECFGILFPDLDIQRIKDGLDKIVSSSYNLHRLDANLFKFKIIHKVKYLYL